MPSRLHFRTVVISLLCCLVVLPLASAQKTKLTRVQVQQLIQAQTPDEVIAKEIQDRGLSFPVDRKIVGALSAKGAGPLTLAALREQIREGEVEVRDTEPGSQLHLDGIVAGNADTLGYFALKEVPEGNHELRVKKDGYRDFQVQFTLANKEDKQLSAPLEWLGGYLSVSAQPADAVIHITGPQSFDGGTTDIKCHTGSYTFTASAEGYVPQTRTFQVDAGEHHAEQVHLAIDQAFVASLLADAKAKFDTRNFSGAIESTRKLLKLTPNEAKTEEILAEASFQTGDFQSFLDAGSKAIASRGEVTVLLMHKHSFPHYIVHDVTLIVDRLNVTYLPATDTKGCKIQRFTQPLRTLRSIGVQRDDNGVLELHLEFLSIKKSILSNHTDAYGNQLIVLDLVMGGSTTNQHFFNSQSQLVQQPANAEYALSSVVGLIKWAAAHPEPTQLSSQVGSTTTGTTPNGQDLCSDYNSCLSAGNQRLFHDEDRSSAIPYFQHALDFRKDATGWIYLGTAYLRAGRPTDVTTAWDEFLKINKQIGMPVCRSNGFDECESGMLILGPKNVTWQVAGRTVFDVPATKVKVIGNDDHQSEGFISFGLEVDGTKYDFEFVTVGVPLNKGSKHVFTDVQGMAQQRIVGDYMSQTIKKLAAGGF